MSINSYQFICQLLITNLVPNYQVINYQFGYQIQYWLITNSLPIVELE